MFQQLWVGVCFAEISRIGKNQSKAMPWICATVWHPLNSSLNPAGMWADSKQGKNSLATLELEKKGLKQLICSRYTEDGYKLALITLL